MNLLLGTMKRAFLEELDKIADSPIYGETKTDPVNSNAPNATGNNEKGYYYQSKNEISPSDKGKPVTRSPYESFSEDDTYGYKEKTAEIKKRIKTEIGRRYPSPEMKREYDAANDNACLTEFSTGSPNQYPRDHMGIKTANLNKFAAVPGSMFQAVAKPTSGATTRAAGMSIRGLKQPLMPMTKGNKIPSIKRKV